MRQRTEVIVRNYALAILALASVSIALEELMLNVNVKRPLAVVSEKFLSVTLDPLVLFNSNMLSNDIERSTSMAKALAPAYVRIAGPRSNSYVFERGLYPQEAPSDPGYTFSETHWINIHKWAERSGLDVIACIAPQLSDNGHSWDPRNALDLISFSDHMGYNTSWQLGYECQTRCEASGAELGREVQRLRSMLDAFPRYNDGVSNHGLIGPDVVAYRTREQQLYLQEYFAAASGALAAVTWHPDFAGISLEAEGVSMHYDNLAAEKDTFYKVAGRHIIKKPLWIAESKPEECKRQFLGALVWARRLGNSAKLGIQVLMRQPDNSNLFRPTPDYWVSILHKMLVGREVLDAKISAGNRTHVSFYSQCTKPSSRYERGSLTIFGINLTPTKVTANLKGLKSKVVHKYILLPGFDAPNRMFAETTLLNNELLTLVGGKEVPKVQPVVYSSEKGVKLKLPSGGIGFWVLPGLKIKTCMGHEEEGTDKNMLKKVAKRIEDSETEETVEVENSREETGINAETQEPKLKQSQKRSSPLSPLPSSRRANRQKEENPESKLDLAKRDLERLDKIMRGRESLTPTPKKEEIHGIFDDSEENKSKNPEDTSQKSNVGMSLDVAGKEIRAKLQEYKKRLDNETRKKKRDLSKIVKKERVKGEQVDATGKGMDTEKVIEALTLITKIENTMKAMEKENETSTLTVAAGDTNDLKLTLLQQNNDALLDEVLNSEKSKRTSVPTDIEDQLKALYQLLSDEREKKENESRQRRDLEKRIENQPSNLQQEIPIGRKRVKVEQIRERRQELKQRRRERQENRRQRSYLHKQDDLENGSEEEEDEIYGFPTQPPLENFPEGDVYVQTGVDSVESKDEDQETARTKIVGVTSAPIILDDEDIHTGHVPSEFYEKVGERNINVKKDSKGHKDARETDLLYNEKKGARFEESPNYQNYEIITEAPVLDTDNQKVKTKNMQQFVNYQTNPESGYYTEFRRTRQQIQYQPPPMPGYKSSSMKKSNAYSSNQAQPAYFNPGYYAYPNEQAVDRPTYRRAKRHINDLENILHQEMMAQDDNNLRDCQCRVNRGVEECKDCIPKHEQYETPIVYIPAPMMQPPMSNLNNLGSRIRREAEMIETNDEAKATTQESTESYEITTHENLENEELNTETTKASDTSYVDQTEIIQKEPNTETSLQESIEATEVAEATTISLHDQLKLESDSNTSSGNRLPRKVGSPPKYIQKIKEATPSKVKEKRESSDTANHASTASQLTTQIEPEITDENKTTENTVKKNITPVSIKLSSRNRSIKTSKEPNNVSQISPNENVTDSSKDTNIDVNTEAIVAKNSKNDSKMERKNKRITKDTTTERKNKQESTSVTTDSLSLTNSNDTEAVKNVTSKTAISTAIDKINVTVAEEELKLKNITTTKPDNSPKPRPARLIMRAEALAALRRENESKRAKKAIETSLKAIENENAKLTEFQKKRREQLEKLKLKLRAKREKMLQQYRDELIEAINENTDVEKSNIQRRDLPENYQVDYEDLKNDGSNINNEKIAYIMRYKPIKYIPDNSEEQEKYVPVMEVIKPYRESQQKHVPISESTDADENNNYEIIENKKQGTPIDIHFEDEIYDSMDDQEYRSTNRKRSPYLYSDRHGVIRRYNYREPKLDYDASEEDSHEYYTQSQPRYRQQVGQYYPHEMYDKRAIVPNTYDLNYDVNQAYRQDEDYGTYLRNQENVQKFQHDSENTENKETMEETSDTNDSEKNEENIQQIKQQIPLQEEQPQLHKQQQIQERKRLQPKLQPEENYHRIMNRSNKNLKTQYEIIKPNYRKTRKSNFKIFEVDPAIYEEDDPSYDLQNLYVKPNYRYSPKTYRHDPYGYIGSRYKRRATSNKKAAVNSPLSFSLGLEKTKMKDIKDPNPMPLESLSRRKRVADTCENKNIKKVSINYDVKNKKIPKNPKYIKTTEVALTISPESSNEWNTEITDILAEDTLKVKNPDINNHLDEDKIGSSKRLKRSMEELFNDPQALRDNSINRSDDPEMDEIWNNIMEMKQDEKLLKEYEREKGKILDDFKETQQNLHKYLESRIPLSNEHNSASTSNNSTTQTNIETIIVDAIPKIETVITGGLKKAQNLTGSVEGFIETFDEEMEQSTEDPEGVDSSETDDATLSRNVFQTIMNNVKKFFHLFTAITKTLK